MKTEKRKTNIFSPRYILLTQLKIQYTLAHKHYSLSLSLLNLFFVVFIAVVNASSVMRNLSAIDYL